ncbi:MAG: RNA polymerase sigma factor [Polyangia bacterium]|nr:RNA polymerase sigma factor [Polyangia bacterium]
MTTDEDAGSTWSVLVRRAQRGDVPAFVRLAEEHQGALFAFATAQLGDPSEAGDVAQEALVKAFRKLKTYRFEAPFRTWLLQIARNVCIDLFRKRQATAEGVRRYARLGTEDSPPDPEAQARAHEVAEEVHAALGAVDPLFREVVILFDLQGHSYHEVADICGVPIGTVKSRLSRGREALRIALKERGHLEIPRGARGREEKKTP